MAIVGGGPTGVELSGAFADLVHRSLRSNFRRIDTSKLRVVLIEGSARVLEAFDEDQSEYARQRLTEIGVEVWTGKRVDEVKKGGLHFTDGSALEAEAIIWAAGVEAQPLTAMLGVPLADRGGRHRRAAARRPVPGVDRLADHLGRRGCRVAVPPARRLPARS